MVAVRVEEPAGRGKITAPNETAARFGRVLQHHVAGTLAMRPPDAARVVGIEEERNDAGAGDATKVNQGVLGEKTRLADRVMSDGGVGWQGAQHGGKLRIEAIDLDLVADQRPRDPEAGKHPKGKSQGQASSVQARGELARDRK